MGSLKINTRRSEAYGAHKRPYSRQTPLHSQNDPLRSRASDGKRAGQRLALPGFPARPPDPVNFRFHYKTKEVIAKSKIPLRAY